MYNDHGLGINDLEIGVSTEGVTAYIDELEAEYLLDVEEKIDDITAITTALDLGWQGVSRDRFDEQFAKMREKIKADLVLEYNDLVGRINELAHEYVYNDKSMIVEE